jgi:hypothetical protein
VDFLYTPIHDYSLPSWKIKQLKKFHKRLKQKHEAYRIHTIILLGEGSLSALEYVREQLNVPGCNVLIRVDRVIREPGGKTTSEPRYFISSLLLSAKRRTPWKLAPVQ